MRATTSSAAQSVRPMAGEDARIGVAEPMEGVVYPPMSDLERYVAAGTLTHETLIDGFRASVDRHAGRPALVGPDLRMTYRDLDEASTRLAGALVDLGLKPLDRVMFQLPNSAELQIGLWAFLKAGLIPVCTLAAHRELEIGYLAGFSEARAHFVDGTNPKFDDVAFAREMQNQAPSLSIILQARGEARNGASGLHDLIDAMPLAEAEKRLETLELDPFQVAVFQLSGGTTGVPKIIPRFHNEYLYNMRAVAERLHYASDDVLFAPNPMIHNLSMGCLFGPMLMSGGAVLIGRGATPDDIVELLKTVPPTRLFLFGPITESLKHFVEAGEIDLSQVRSAIAPQGSETIRASLGLRVTQIFGMTEGMILITDPDDPEHIRDRTHGRPVSPFDEIRIHVPGTEYLVAPGEIGEPAFKGPYTIHGYYRAPERNLETFTSDGFYVSGDLLRMVESDGLTSYAFCGRTKDVVSRGGEKINCEEIEMALINHPDVTAVAAVPYPCPIYDERLCAVLTLKPGRAEPTVKDIGAFLENYGMAKFKWPERVEIVEALPLTAAAKLDRKALRANVAAFVAAEKEDVAG